MCEVKAGDSGGREHGETFGEMDTYGIFDMEEIEECAFFGMVGASGITGGGADAAIAFADQIIVAEVFLLAESPFVANALVEVFGEGFGESVSECFGGDGVVIVVIGFVMGDQFIGSKTRGNAEGSEIIVSLAVVWGDEVSEGVAGCIGAAALLSEGAEACLDGGAGVVGVEDDIVTVAVCGEEAVDAVRLEFFVFDDIAQHDLCVVKEFLCALTDDGVLEDGGVRAVEFPCTEEGRPIDEGDEFCEGKIFEDAHTEEGGLWDIGL